MISLIPPRQTPVSGDVIIYIKVDILGSKRLVAENKKRSERALLFS